MATALILDKRGRLVLPRAVRDSLRLKPGDPLLLRTSKGEVVLRPVRGKARMHKKGEVWVFDGGTPLPPDIVERTIQKVSRERERHILGQSLSLPAPRR